MAFLAQKSLSLAAERSTWQFQHSFFLEGWSGKSQPGCMIVYLSGINFQVLSLFHACPSLSIVCSNSPFIFRKNTLMAGSTIVDLFWVTLGCWACLRYWVWGRYTESLTPWLLVTLKGCFRCVQTLVAALVFLQTPLASYIIRIRICVLTFQSLDIYLILFPS